VDQKPNPRIETEKPKESEKSTHFAEKENNFLALCKNILVSTVGLRNKFVEGGKKMSEGRKQNMEQEVDQNTMSIAMPRELQRELETLKKQ